MIAWTWPSGFYYISQYPKLDWTSIIWSWLNWSNQITTYLFPCVKTFTLNLYWLLGSWYDKWAFDLTNVFRNAQSLRYVKNSQREEVFEQNYKCTSSSHAINQISKSVGLMQTNILERPLSNFYPEIQEKARYTIGRNQLF